MQIGRKGHLAVFYSYSLHHTFVACNEFSVERRFNLEIILLYHNVTDLLQYRTLRIFQKLTGFDVIGIYNCTCQYVTSERHFDFSPYEWLVIRAVFNTGRDKPLAKNVSHTLQIRNFRNRGMNCSGTLLFATFFSQRIEVLIVLIVPLKKLHQDLDIRRSSCEIALHFQPLFLIIVEQTLARIIRLKLFPLALFKHLIYIRLLSTTSYFKHRHRMQPDNGGKNQHSYTFLHDLIGYNFVCRMKTYTKRERYLLYKIFYSIGMMFSISFRNLHSKITIKRYYSGNF